MFDCSYVDGPEPSASCPNYGSGRTSPNTESEATQSLVSMSNDFTTGCNTERSSLCSFDDVSVRCLLALECC